MDNIETFGSGGQFESTLPEIDVQVEDKTFHVLVATSDEEKEIGLMNVEELDPDEGMLFDYSDDPQESLSFWMKDTTIPLDIIFINEKGVVISVMKGEPESEEMLTEDSEPISCVLEVSQNSGIQKGDKTDLFGDIDDEDDDFEEDVHPDLKVNKLYVYGSDGEVQGEIDSGCRIFSRKSTKTIIHKAKKAYFSKLDKDYKALARYVFNEIKAQDNRKPEYVEQ